MAVLKWLKSFENIEYGIEIKYQAQVSYQLSAHCEDQKASTERFKKTFNSYSQRAIYGESWDKYLKYLNLMER